MKIDKGNITSVPFRRMEGVKPNDCFGNAKLLADCHGGRPVIGWAVTDMELLLRLIPHAVWEDAEGKWLEATPFWAHSRWGGVALFECGRDFVEEHQPVPTHESLPSKLVPKVPEAEEACQFLNRAMSYSGDREKVIYWDGRARSFLARHGIDLRLIELNNGTHDYLAPAPLPGSPLSFVV